jgi:hypothetical protein
LTAGEEARTPAPAVTLKAIGHGRELTFNQLGKTAVLICVARETSDLAPPVVTAIRETYGGADEVIIASIADARAFPRIIRKVAEQIMKSSYNDAVKNLLPGRTPEEYVLIVPDWDGRLLGPLGIADVTKAAAAVVIDAQGDIVGTYQGDDPRPHVLRLIEAARTDRA